MRSLRDGVQSARKRRRINRCHRRQNRNGTALGEYLQLTANPDLWGLGVSQNFSHFIKGAINSKYLILPKDDETFFMRVVDEAHGLNELSIHREFLTSFVR